MPRERHRLPCAAREEIARRYLAGESTPKLKDAFGLPDNGSVSRILKKQGVEIRANGFHQRKHFVEHGYFSEITRSVQAYLIGLLAADGCVRRVKNTGSVSLTCHKNDAQSVELLRKEIGGTIYAAKGGLHLTWSVWSQPLATQLIDLGITPRKSLTMKVQWDLIPKSLIRYFLLGVLDGDGGILDLPGHYRLQIVTASPVFAQDLLDRIPGSVQIISNPKNPRHSPLHRINVSGRDRLSFVLNWLYSDLPFSSLVRKKNVAVKIINWAAESQEIDEKREEMSLQLASAYSSGTSGTNLARQQDLSPVTVYKMVRRVGGHIKPSSRAIQARLSALPLEDRYFSERVKDIASDLGVTKTTIYNHLRRAGVKVIQVARTDVPDAEIIRLHGEGLSTRQIGEQVGMHPASISHRCRKLGLVMRGNFSANSVAHSQNKIVDFYREGKSVREISRMLNLTPVTVYKYLDLAGVDRPRR